MRLSSMFAAALLIGGLPAAAHATGSVCPPGSVHIGGTTICRPGDPAVCKAVGGICAPITPLKPGKKGATYWCESGNPKRCIAVMPSQTR